MLEFFEMTKELSAEDLMKLLNTSVGKSILSFSQEDIVKDFPELHNRKELI